MTERIFELIDWLRHFRVPEILGVLGAVLVLIDYFFPTDWPAHLGYVCFSACMFFVAFMYGLAPVWALVVSLVAWFLLEWMHRLFFKQYLDNVPDEPDESGVADASDAAGNA